MRPRGDAGGLRCGRRQAGLPAVAAGPYVVPHLSALPPLLLAPPPRRLPPPSLPPSFVDTTGRIRTCTSLPSMSHRPCTCPFLRARRMGTRERGPWPPWSRGCKGRRRRRVSFAHVLSHTTACANPGGRAARSARVLVGPRTDLRAALRWLLPPYAVAPPPPPRCLSTTPRHAREQKVRRAHHACCSRADAAPAAAPCCPAQPAQSRPPGRMPWGRRVPPRWRETSATAAPETPPCGVCAHVCPHSCVHGNVLFPARHANGRDRR